MADSRFVFADVSGNLKARRQLISGLEMRYYKPRGDLTTFYPGQELDFILAPGPFMVSNLNHIELRVVIKHRAKADGQNPAGAWENAYNGDVLLVENVGSRFFEEVVFRKGESEQKTNYSFVSRGGRALWEAFSMAHSDQTVRDAYNFRKYDPNNTVRPDKNAWRKDAAEYKNFMTKNMKRSGAKFHVAPFAFPFETISRSRQTDHIFPNYGNDAVVGVMLNRCFESLHTSTEREVEFEIKSIRLAIATPRMTPEGRSALARKSQPPIRYPGNKITQDIFFTGKDQKNIRLRLNRKQLPNYVVLQMYEDKYFTNDYVFTDEKKQVAYPLATNVSNVEILYKGLELFQHVSPLDFENKFASIMRQNLMRTVPDILACSKLEQTWVQDSATYAQEHLFFCFESNTRDHELMVPLDGDVVGTARQDKTEDHVLEITLETRTGYLPENARIVLTSIDVHKGLIYNMKDGTLDA